MNGTNRERTGIPSAHLLRVPSRGWFWLNVLQSCRHSGYYSSPNDVMVGQMLYIGCPAAGSTGVEGLLLLSTWNISLYSQITHVVLYKGEDKKNNKRDPVDELCIVRQCGRHPSRWVGSNRVLMGNLNSPAKKLCKGTPCLSKSEAISNPFVTFCSLSLSPSLWGSVFFNPLIGSAQMVRFRFFNFRLDSFVKKIHTPSCHFFCFWNPIVKVS